jgi:hypothetical protein
LRGSALCELAIVTISEHITRFLDPAEPGGREFVVFVLLIAGVLALF